MAILDKIPNARRRIPLLNRRRLARPLFLVANIPVAYALGYFAFIDPGWVPSVQWLIFSWAAFDVTFLCYQSFNHISNRCDVLYLRKYEEPPSHFYLKPGVVRRVVNRNLTSLQHTSYYALAYCYDMVGLLPPPRADFEKVADDYDFRQPEAQYLLKTLNDDDWRVSLTRLVNECRAVIVECSVLTESLRWEISEVLRCRGAAILILVAEKENERAAREVVRRIAALSRKTSPKSEKLDPRLLVLGTTWDRRFRHALLQRVHAVAGKTSRDLFRHRALFWTRRLFGVFMWIAAGFVAWRLWALISIVSSSF